MKSQNENSATDQKKKQNSKPYIFAQKEGDDFTCIKLIEGKYEGVVYKYNHVKFAPHENEQGQIPLKFTYDIFQNPEKVDVESQDFRFYIGDILVELVEEQLNNGTVKFEK
jgi:hypothetical protein